MQYEEKHWMPLWVVAAIVLAPEVIAIPIIYGDAHSLFAWILPAACGAVVALVFWGGIARRWIRVDGRSLRITAQKAVPLSEVTGARIVEGRELKQLRQAFSQGRGLPVGAAALPAVPVAGGALGSLAMGYSLLRGGKTGRGIKRGALTEPWMKQAVLVSTPGNERTPAYLIGTRHPEELRAAVLQGAQASVPSVPAEATI
jgi:Protein of unknown function (DUF3093)